MEVSFNNRRVFTHADRLRRAQPKGHARVHVQLFEETAAIPTGADEGDGLKRFRPFLSALHERLALTTRCCTQALLQFYLHKTLKITIAKNRHQIEY